MGCDPFFLPAIHPPAVSKASFNGRSEEGKLTSCKLSITDRTPFVPIDKERKEGGNGPTASCQMSAWQTVKKGSNKAGREGAVEVPFQLISSYSGQQNAKFNLILRKLGVIDPSLTNQ